MKDYFTIEDAAQNMGLHPSTIQKFCKSGRLKATKVKEKHYHHWLIAENDLKAFINIYEKEKQTPKKRKRYIFSPVIDQKRKELTEVIDEYIKQGNYILSAEEYIKLMKLRLKQTKSTWIEFFGTLKEEEIARLPEKKLHLLAQAMRFSGMGVRGSG